VSANTHAVLFRSISIILMLATSGCAGVRNALPTQPSADTLIDRTISPEIVGIERERLSAVMRALPRNIQADLGPNEAIFLVEASAQGEAVYVNHPGLRGVLVKVVPEPGNPGVGRLPDGREMALPPTTDDSAELRLQSSIAPAMSSCGPTVPTSQTGAYRAIVSCQGNFIAGGLDAPIVLPCNNTISGSGSTADGGYVYIAHASNLTANGFQHERETGLEYDPSKKAWDAYIRTASIAGFGTGTGQFYYVENTPPPTKTSGAGIHRFPFPTAPPNWEFQCSDPTQMQIEIKEEESQSCGYFYNGYWYGGYSGPWPCTDKVKNTPGMLLVYDVCVYSTVTLACDGSLGVQIYYEVVGTAGSSTVDGFPWWQNCGKCLIEWVTSIAYNSKVKNPPSSLGTVQWSGFFPATQILACVDNPPWLTNEPNQTAECKTGPPTGGNPVIQVPSYGTDFNGNVYQNVYINAPQ
jgi:hypothetical protein